MRPHFVIRIRDHATQNRLLVAYDDRARQLGTVTLPPDDTSVWRGSATPDEFLKHINTSERNHGEQILESEMPEGTQAGDGEHRLAE